MAELHNPRVGGSMPNVVLAATLCATMVSTGVNALPVLLAGSLVRDLDWPGPILFAGMSIGMFLSALAAPASVWMISRFGLRNVITLALTVLLASLFGSSVANSAWQLSLVWALSATAGGCLSPFVISAVFTSGRLMRCCGATSSLYFSASLLGPALVLPLSFLIGSGSRLTALLIVGGVVVMVLVAVMLLLPREQPTQGGVKPQAKKPASAKWPGSEDCGFVLLLLSLSMICGITSTGLVDSHIISLCGGQGLPLHAGASTSALVGLAAIVGGLAFGSLADRFNPRWLLVVYYTGRTMLLFWLPHSSMSFEELARFGVLYGLDWAATMPALMAFAARRLATETVAPVMSMMAMAHLGGGAATTFLVSVAGPSNFAFSFAIGAALCLVAVFLLLVTSPQMGRNETRATRVAGHGGTRLR